MPGPDAEQRLLKFREGEVHLKIRNGLILLAIVACFSLASGCSKSYDTAEPFHLDRLKAPTGLKSEWRNGDEIDLTWDISDPGGVVYGFIVSMSDSTGIIYEEMILGSDVRSYIDNSDYANGALVDSVWYYFQVRAVDENLFKGPKSDSDSLFIP